MNQQARERDGAVGGAHQELFDGLGATDTRKPASDEALAATRRELDEFMREFSSDSGASR